MQNLGINILFEPMVLERLLTGLRLNLEVALSSILFTIIFGCIFGIIRVLGGKFTTLTFKIYLDIIRVMPTLVLLFIAYFILPEVLDIELDTKFIGILTFAFWGAAEMSDIVRSAIISLPKHQRESGLAIGLNTFQLYIYILLPQSIKAIFPASLNLFSRIIMTSSLLVLIGGRDVIKVGKEIIEINTFVNKFAPFWIYGFILILFFTICYSLGKIANQLEKRWK